MAHETSRRIILDPVEPQITRGEFRTRLSIIADIFTASPNQRDAIITAYRCLSESGNDIVQTPFGRMGRASFSNTFDILHSINSSMYNNSKEQVSNTIQSDNGYNSYENLLRFTPDDLGDLSLNIGSGAKGRFEREARKRGTKVIAINPLLLNKESRTNLKKRILKKKLFSPAKNAIAAFADKLPIASNSVDSVVSLYGVSYFGSLVPFDEGVEIYKEVFRVLKPGRKAFIGPFDLIDMERAVAMLSASGLYRYIKSVTERYDEEEKGKKIRMTYSIVIQKPS